MPGAVFDRIMRAGRRAVEDGSQRLEVPPESTGRWGLSAVLRLDGAVATTLDQLTREVADIAGAWHWLSGTIGHAHLTVRALELFADGDVSAERLGRYRRALEASVPADPIRFGVGAPLLSPAGVLVRCRPETGAADELRARFARALGADGWLEDAAFENGRDPIWYTTVLHFADRVADPDRLLSWVDDRRALTIGETTADAVDLCTWHHDGSAMAPTVRASVPLCRDEATSSGDRALGARPALGGDV